MTVASVLLLCVTAQFAASKDLALQIGLDREGFSCNAIDGSWGSKSERALARWMEFGTAGGVEAYGRGIAGVQVEDLRKAVFADHFARGEPLFRYVRVTESDIASLVNIPQDPAERSRLKGMSYESLKEMFAERGHLSQRALERLNPRVDWARLKPGDVVRLPHFTSMEEYLSSWPRRPNAPNAFPEASYVRISLSRCEITAWSAAGEMLASFPCSIARSKAKRPSNGVLRVMTAIAYPNYTYTPDDVPAGKPAKRYVWPPGPNCPVGVAWLGLSLPGYGIHGTPNPETIGRPESHGCFRLSNWNAARLYSMVRPGAKVVIED